MAHSMFRSVTLPLCLAALSSVGVVRSASPQSSPGASDVRHEVFAGSGLEDYLRYLQLDGSVPLRPWSIRAFSPNEVSALVRTADDHPWSKHFTFTSDSARTSGFSWLRPSAQAIYNSAFPYGSNDGPIWAGRGVTTAVQAGFAAEYGPVSLTVAPIAFRAENAAFELVENGMEGQLRFANAIDPQYIDLPQRFGEAAYTRIDPGQSTLRLDYRGLASGVSTANHVWGPADQHPLILGNNAAGFPHVFLGTSRPVGVGIGSIHGRMVWGRLQHSAYTPAASGNPYRLMSGLVVVFSPRALSGLEIGGSRFFHSIWPGRHIGLDNLFLPIEAFYRKDTSDPLDDDLAYASNNQLASIFSRWVAPRSGFEIYAEYAREDANWDWRDFVLEPDQQAGYALGARKLWRRSEGNFVGIRAEVINTQINALPQVRMQSTFYRHSLLVQGHTFAGQALGSASGFAGGGSFVAFDSYYPRGRWTAFIARDLLDHETITRPSAGRNVNHSVGGEILLLRQPNLLAGVTNVYQQNRGGDLFNLSVTAAVTWKF